MMVLQRRLLKVFWRRMQADKVTTQLLKNLFSLQSNHSVKHLSMTAVEAMVVMQARPVLP